MSELVVDPRVYYVSGIGRARAGLELALHGSLLCAAYYLGTVVGYALIFPSSYFSVVWPPNTILLVALLLSPPRRWPWILLIVLPVHMAAQAQYAVSTSTAGLYYVYDCVLVLTTAVVLRRCGLGQLGLDSLRQTLVFLVATTVAVASATLVWSPLIVSLSRGGDVWLQWGLAFMSNQLPFLVAAPGIVIALTRGVEMLRSASPARLAELGILAVSLLLCTVIVRMSPPMLGSLPAFFCAPLPVLLWAAVRFGPAGLSIAFTMFGSMAISNAVAGDGPFVTQSAHDNVLWLQLFLLVLYVPMLVLATVGEERRGKEAALRENEARYRGIVEDQTELICRFRADGTYTFVNGAYCRYFQTTPERLLGWNFWGFIPFDRHPAAREFLDSISPDHPVASCEHEVLAPGGGIRWQQWTDRGFFDEHGRIVEYQAVGRDITERKRAEEEHRLLEAQKHVEAALRETDRRKDEFLAMLAHELRNPLAAVTMAVALLRRLERPNEEVSWARDLIGRQAGQLTRLVDDLLDLSRITRGKIKVRMAPLDLHSVIAHAVETSLPLMLEREHRFSTDIPPTSLRLRADGARLAQLISNLLNNAARYTDVGGSIHLSARREGSEILLSVSDNGVGISPDMLDRVFDLFTQVERVSEDGQGGLGIGLTLVKRLVELHGGSVEARSAGSGLGSEFIVRLPALTDLEPVPEASFVARTFAGTTHGLRILVVDDNADAADAMARMLELKAHEVEVVHDGRSALRAFERVCPDVVLLDLGLPEFDGLQVARALRKRGDKSQVLLVAMTGFGRDEDRRRTAEAGFDHHLVKPVDFAALDAVLAGSSKRSA
jgi:PAS domain S-box-containing protein